MTDQNRPPEKVPGPQTGLANPLASGEARSASASSAVELATERLRQIVAECESSPTFTAQTPAQEQQQNTVGQKNAEGLREVAAEYVRITGAAPLDYKQFLLLAGQVAAAREARPPGRVRMRPDSPTLPGLHLTQNQIAAAANATSVGFPAEVLSRAQGTQRPNGTGERRTTRGPAQTDGNSRSSRRKGRQ